jgi:hypothetical protein
VVGPNSGLDLDHLQHVGTGNARAKKAVAINFADVSDLVADWRDLADSGKESLLRVLLHLPHVHDGPSGKALRTFL